MTDINLLVRAGFLYPMSEGLPIVERGEVAVVGDRIVYAGPEKPAGAWRPARTLGGPGKAVLPGLVNCHCHAASLVFRSQTDDLTGGAALYTIGQRWPYRLGVFVGLLSRGERSLSTIGSVL